MKHRQAKLNQQKENPSSATKASASIESARHEVKGGVVGMEEWEWLGVPAPLIRSLYELGFKVPTPIQKQAIPVTVKTENDIIGAAETVRRLSF